MNFQRPEGHYFKQARILECVSKLCIRSMKLCYSFQYLQWVGQPGGSGLCWYLACLSGDAAGIGGTEATAGLGDAAGVGETEAAVGLGGSAFGASTGLVLIAVVSRRGGPAA